ncbi:hypothetical protein K438DRAFT_1789457 [Mycena galopus ATCC 62051]|nr:hypothetical protein K438DRAFT_1789457 [Mycena galopus ATCC 62051]
MASREGPRGAGCSPVLLSASHSGSKQMIQGRSFHSRLDHSKLGINLFDSTNPNENSQGARCTLAICELVRLELSLDHASNILRYSYLSSSNLVTEIPTSKSCNHEPMLVFSPAISSPPQAREGTEAGVRKAQSAGYTSAIRVLAKNEILDSHLCKHRDITDWLHSRLNLQYSRKGPEPEETRTKFNLVEFQARKAQRRVHFPAGKGPEARSALLLSVMGAFQTNDTGTLVRLETGPFLGLD